MLTATVIKRDGSEVKFNVDKIYQAVYKAAEEVGHTNERSESIAFQVCRDFAEAYYINESDEFEMQVEEIQDAVEEILMREDPETAKAYILYRYKHELARAKHNDEEILAMIQNDPESYWATENSNKNAKLVTVQRDYLAGITSTDIARRYIFPKEVIKAHDAGMCHQHDMDYMAQATIHNCFSVDTAFVTDEGVKTFNDFYDGSPVVVRDKNGQWRNAVVHNFGKQILYTVTLQSERSQQKIRCTRNHRWVLQDGTVTEDLQVGDSLFLLPDVASSYTPTTVEDIKAFCYGFVIGDGSNIPNNRGVRVRLCGHKKNDYLNYFEQVGYQVAAISGSEDVVVTNKDAFDKQVFLDSRAWQMMSTKQKIALFNGYYAADGCVGKNKIHTCDERNLELILALAPIAGYYIANVRHDIHDTTFKTGASLYTVTFRKKNNPNNAWKVKEIKKSCNNNHTSNVWCVVEPVTHTFTLASGIVTGNCDLINLEDMLQNGTVINNVRINKPHRLLTAMTITTQIMASVAANSYGGETITLTHLAPFVRSSYNIFIKKYQNKGLSEELIKKLAKEDLDKEISDAVQTFNYQISTLFTLNGQAPFCSVFMYLNETTKYKKELILLIKEFLRQRISGMSNRQGVKVTQAFPKILYVLQEDNYKPGTKYWDVTKLAIECSACRLTPDYISEKVMKQIKVDENGEGHCFPCMGCRSFLSPYIDKDGKPKYYGRFNCGVSSLNLPDIAFYADEKAKTQEEKIQIFFEELDRRAEICHEGLKIRIDRLSKTKAGVAPILWVDGALARKNPDDTLYDLVHGGYSTASLGYNGGAETVQILIGESNTTKQGQALMLKILQFLSDKCEEWKIKEDVGYSLYGSPAESLCYKFAAKTKERYPEKFEKLFGNKKYFENSYHIPSSEPIDPFTKIKTEGQFQKFSAGGCLSYVESVNLSNNVSVLYPVLEAIYNNIMYCEINMKTSYCHVCGSNDMIDVHKNERGDTWWECAECGNKNISKMDVAARTCGYIGVNWWNEGKTQEIASRYCHLDDHEIEE